jgi:soluble lytic murein transglycosylase-like protein
MSTEALAGPSTGVPAGELAISQRVRQLQALIEATGQASTNVPTPVATTASAQAAPVGFAASLQAATAAGASTSSNQGSAASGQYDSLIAQAAQRYGVDPAILHGLIQQESGFDPNARSGAGASGLTQLMPGTAASLGVADPLNPAESIDGGARYLSQMMSTFGGNASEALAAYNAGPGAVQKYGGVPPYAETQGYVTKVLANAEAYRQGTPASTSTGGLA